MRTHVNIFDSIIFGFAGDSRGKRSEESWGDESAARESDLKLAYQSCQLASQLGIC
jgi:hypothetical protein